MTEQRLFDLDRHSPSCPCWYCSELPSRYTVRDRDPATSQAVARRPRRGLRLQVLEVHERHPDGLTDDQLARLLPDRHPGSLSKRRGELVALGFIADTGTTRLEAIYRGEEEAASNGALRIPAGGEI